MPEPSIRVSASDIPIWLRTMRAATGISETPGSANEPRIMAMRTRIAEVYPEMAAYCRNYTHDAIPWCGLTMAYVMADNGYRPVFGSSDNQRFLWARAWEDWGTKITEPRLGCVVVMSREGGGHVTLFEEDAGSNFKGRGGNQSDAINVSTFPKSAVLAYVWPDELPDTLPAPDPASMPWIKLGDSGPAVVQLQRLLGGIDVDGEFGPQTDAAVRQFQTAHGLEVDGEVGPLTWAALLGDIAVEDDLTPAQVSEISTLAAGSPIARYSWKDRGIAPAGYTKGMACTYAYVYRQLKAGNSAATVMAQAVGSEDKDALAWYAPQFQSLGTFTASAGVQTLRNLFTLMLGLGMRESSGRYCTGRDRSATNTSADTAEAGLFQTSWNAHAASPEMRNLFEQYSSESQQGETGFVEVFRERVACSTADWQDYGSGDGAAYQALSKRCPAFHCEFSAIGLRVLRKHWGPINRREAELRKDAYDLFKQIELVVDRVAPEPPEPLSWAEKTTAAIVEAIAPVILDVLEASQPPPPATTVSRTAVTTITAPIPATVAPTLVPEGKPAGLPEVATAAMPLLREFGPALLELLKKPDGSLDLDKVQLVLTIANQMLTTISTKPSPVGMPVAPPPDSPPLPEANHKFPWFRK